MTHTHTGSRAVPQLLSTHCAARGESMNHLRPLALLANFDTDHLNRTGLTEFFNVHLKAVLISE